MGSAHMGIPVHVERLDSGSYRITADLPCAASMQRALNDLTAINPDAYRALVPDGIASVMGAGHPFVGDDEVPLRAGGTD